MINIAVNTWAYELRGKKIDQLQEQVRQRDVSCEKLHAENLNLRDENTELAEQRVKNDRIIENQKYQLGQYATELETLQEEVKALKYFARRYLEV